MSKLGTNNKAQYFSKVYSLEVVWWEKDTASKTSTRLYEEIGLIWVSPSLLHSYVTRDNFLKSYRASVTALVPLRVRDEMWSSWISASLEYLAQRRGLKSKCSHCYCHLTLTVCSNSSYCTFHSTARKAKVQKLLKLLKVEELLSYRDLFSLQL